MIAGADPEASEVFARYSGRGSHYWRTPEAGGKVDMEAANRYLREVYLPAFNTGFAQPAMEEGSALVPWFGGNIDDILGEQSD